MSPDDTRDIVEAERIKSGLPPRKNGRGPNASRIEIYTAAQLGAMELADTKLIVPRILPEGITLLVGKAKLGKSWLALGLGVAIATGGYGLGTLRVEQGDVLYIALEDTKRRLKKRLTKLMAGSPFPDRLTFANSWPRIDQGGVAIIGAWIEKQPNPRLVIIDTFARFRPRRPEKHGGYDEDYADVEALQALAAEFGVAVLVLHHQRKAEAEDPLDTISGTLGLGAAADGALILERERGAAEASLKVISRDLEDEPELTLRWDRDIAAWTIAGEGPRLTPERRKILAAVRDAGEPIGPAEVAKITGLPVGSIRNSMPEMAKDGHLVSTKYGRYEVRGSPDSDDSGDTSPRIQVEVSPLSSLSSSRAREGRICARCDRPGALRAGDRWWCGSHYPGDAGAEEEI